MYGRRVPVRKNKDRKVFSHTAVKGKKVNVNPRVARGGIRM